MQYYLSQVGRGQSGSGIWGPFLSSIIVRIAFLGRPIVPFFNNMIVFNSKNSIHEWGGCSLLRAMDLMEMGRIHEFKITLDHWKTNFFYGIYKFTNFTAEWI